jgi:glycosyltransferase involved in cell wall biosynthesis
VFDALSHGIPLIVNAHGTMRELPRNGEVIVLEDRFEIGDLAAKIKELYSNRTLRADMSEKSKGYIEAHHIPSISAQKYARAIETFAAHHSIAVETRLIDAVSSINITEEDLSATAEAIVYNHHRLPQRQLLVDVSAIVLGDLKTGIQRVVRSIVSEMLISCPSGYRVEPIYDDHGTYRYAREYTSNLAEIGAFGIEDDVVETYSGDVFVGLDFYSGGTVRNEETFIRWRTRGVSIHFIIYDLLPIFFPQFFMPRADEIHITWLKSIVKHAHSLICISESVAEELRRWMRGALAASDLPAVSSFHLGADVNNSASSEGIESDAEAILEQLSTHQSFLMVGTIEPRKGHAQTLSAFELLWERGLEANLVIVGKGGWLVDELIEKLEGHPMLNTRLFWLRGISDEFLEKTYQVCSALIAASEGEGFGLPLIEAAQHQLPIIARDIPVFREVGGEHAFYFTDTKDPESLADTIRVWIELNAQGSVPSSVTMPWLRWSESTAQLLEALHLKRV